MTCLGVLDTGEWDDENETSLKEGGIIEISTTVLSITRCSLSFAFEYLPYIPEETVAYLGSSEAIILPNSSWVIEGTSWCRKEEEEAEEEMEEESAIGNVWLRTIELSPIICCRLLPPVKLKKFDVKTKKSRIDNSCYSVCKSDKIVITLKKWHVWVF